MTTWHVIEPSWDDWDALPSWMFSADEDRPPPVCHCRHCKSEGFYPQDATCVHRTDPKE